MERSRQASAGYTANHRDLRHTSNHAQLSGGSAGAVSVVGGDGAEVNSDSHSADLDAYYQSTQGSSPAPGNNFQVVIRVRPPLPRELHGERVFQNTVALDSTQQLTLSENLHALTAARQQQGAEGGAPAGIYATHQFTFDHVHGPAASQESVYKHSAKGAVMSTLEGYNATIIAYGPTGTGKTYTMEGPESTSAPASGHVERGGGVDGHGIIPRAIQDIFGYISNDTSASRKYLVRASYLQIYNEVISDLLKPERTNLMIREEKRRGIFVEGLSEWVVRSTAEIYGLMQRGAAQRAVGSTRLNEISSRSHAVFMIITENVTIHAAEGEQSPAAPQAGANGEAHQSFKVGKLNLVDLAGSERVRLTGATGQRLEESKKINQSLSALGNVIAALTDPRGRRHVPYRDSKLTRILEDSLGGNCKTTMMAMISPALESFMESLSTLKFVNRAKNIKNEPHVNEDLDQKTLLLKYEHELRRLRSELQQRSKTLVDKRRLLEVEEQKRRAEEDKLAAITELEAQSMEFMREKGEKRQLEQRINSLQSQLLVGGTNMEETPAFRAMLQQEQRRIRTEYEQRLKDMERERHAVDHDRAQVDRYKQVLLKQRDIMIALTARLNERDEQILALQEEVEAYDQHQHQLEDQVDSKTSELIALRKAAMEHAHATPLNASLQRALGLWGSTADHPPPRVVPGPVEVDAPAGPRGGAAGEDNDARASPERLAGYARELAGLQPNSARFIDTLASAIHAEARIARAEGAAAESANVATSQGREILLLRKQLDQLKMSQAGRAETAQLQGSEAGARGSGGNPPTAGDRGPSDEAAVLEGRMHTMKKQHASFRQDMTQRLEDQRRLIQRYEEESQKWRQQSQQSNAHSHSQDMVVTSPTRSSQLHQHDVGSSQLQEVRTLREQVANHSKERAALKTILESKIRTLVDGIGHSIKELPEEARRHPRLMREVQALEKLVHATVNAMRAAAMPSNQAVLQGSAP